MNFYEKLPNNLLIDFYHEINRNIENGIITKTMYYELGLLISVMNRKGIKVEQASAVEHVVGKNVMKNISA